MKGYDNLGHKVSIIIPTLNEQDAIGQVLSSVPAGVAEEIIVVDGSSDNTAEIAESLGARVIHEPRRGYGRALQTGIENALGDIVVYIDGDRTYDPSDIPKLIKPIQDGEYDAVLGNRLKDRANHASMPLLNRVGNKLLSLIFSLLFHVELGDTQCGLRALPRQPLLSYEYRSYGMAYVTEQLVRLVKSGHRIGEVPISYNRRKGKSKLRRFRDGIKILWTMLRERLQG
jgi:dolichol-phosphate mannosyltransferase